MGRDFLFLFAVTVPLWRKDVLRRDNCGKESYAKNDMIRRKIGIGCLT